MKKIVLIIGILVLNGCAMSAKPMRATDGNYYMVGDSNCNGNQTYVQYNRAYCYDRSGNYTGFRDALTAQDIQMYQYQKMREQQNIKAAINSLNDLGESMQQQGRDMQQMNRQQCESMNSWSTIKVPCF